MRLKLVQVGDPVLRSPARELRRQEVQSREIQQLIEFMHETLRDAPGVGLAAPQVGESLQFAVIEDLPEYSRNLTPEQLTERERKPVPFHVIINPTLSPVGEPDVEFFEGCLSLNGFTALVPRHRSIRVDCLDEHGEPKTIDAFGWYARILQHEIDHLQGTLYIDRMQSRTFMSLDNFTRQWKDATAEEVKRKLVRG
jgi:peptide deformylase